MKKLLFLSAMAVFFAVAASAQPSDTETKKDASNSGDQEVATKIDKKEARSIRHNEVSFQSKEQLYRDFGDVNVEKWERSGNFDKATFVKDGETSEAFYDYNSDLIGTTTNKTFSQLPAKAQEYIKDKYNDYEIKDVVFFDDNEYNDTDIEMYGLQFQNADNYFVELQKDNKEFVIESNLDGQVFFFKQVK